MSWLKQSCFFAGGEDSGIELLQTLILLVLTVYCIRQYARHSIESGSRFALASMCIGVLVFMVGRELSFGKYQGIEEHSTRTVLRAIVYAAILAFWFLSFRRVRPGWRQVAARSMVRVSEHKALLACAVATLGVSQIIDKDIGYAIQPPELAQALEESLETMAYFFLGLFLWRLLRKSATSST